MNIENIVNQSKVKGVNVVGTGDILFPLWKKEVVNRTSLESSGLFVREGVKFVLTAEVCLISEELGKTRKVHLLLTFPDLYAVDVFAKVFNIYSNFEISPRPSIHISGMQFVKLLKKVSPDINVIPAHIFTPWYGILGGNSGFDSVEDCFGDQTDHIFACETGLSADPFLAYSIASLRKYSMVSFSDAHSPGRIGREAIVVEKFTTYKDLFRIIRSHDPESFLLTIEVLPEEGKYFSSGHRKCGYKSSSYLENRNCPVCGKPLTQGVIDRIRELGGDSSGKFTYVPFKHVIPLTELLRSCKKRHRSIDFEGEYKRAIELFENELNVLIFAKESDLKTVLSLDFVQCIVDLRKENVDKESGYDGVYGKIKIRG